MKNIISSLASARILSKIPSFFSISRVCSPDLTSHEIVKTFLEKLPVYESSHHFQVREYGKYDHNSMSIFKRKKYKKKGFKGFMFRQLRNMLIAMIFMFTSIKLYHKLRLHDSRKRFHSKTLTKVIQIFEGQFRFGLCMSFFVYNVGKYITLTNTYKKVLKLDDEEIERRMQKFHDKTAKKILKLFLKLGGLFIKFGQEVSMIPMLPEVYHTTLEVLQDKVSPLEWEDIEGLIYEEVGKDLNKIFEISESDKAPVAAASLAQVYKWKLRKTGEKVAVKVQYPLALYYIGGDVFIQKASMWLGSLFDENLKQSYEGFKENFTLFEKELDFENEAKNQEKCRKMFSKLQYITAPKVVKEFSTGRLLTMEWVDGVKPTDVKGIEKLGYTRAQVAERIFEAFGKMIFEHGFIHGDLHAGNMFVCRNEKSKKIPKIVFLDHGLYTKMPEKFRKEYAKFWKALIMNDKEYMTKYCKQFGISNYRYFVMMNTMQQYDGILKDDMMEAGGKFKIPDKWVNDMKKMKKGDKKTLKKYKEVEEVMYKIPPGLLFVIRSSFILGFINSKLGAPVNRFSLMARIAQRNCNEESVGSLCKFFEGYKFDMNLKIREIKSLIVSWMLRAYFWWNKNKTGGTDLVSLKK